MPKTNKSKSEITRKEWRPPSSADLAKFREILRLVQEDAKRAGLDKMTMRQINAEIAAAREAYLFIPFEQLTLTTLLPKAAAQAA